MSKYRIALVAVSLAVFVAPPAAPQEWRAFFDSGGFEEFPLGPVPDSTSSPYAYERILPHVIVGKSTTPPRGPEVMGAPTIGGTAIMIEAVQERPFGDATWLDYRHEYERFGKAFFAFPGHSGRGGYRGLRASFDMYHGFDPVTGGVAWPGGGVSAYRGETYAQLVWDVTERVEPLFDEWVHVSLTYDFEHDLFRGSYAEHESDWVPLPSELLTLESWRFLVRTAPRCDCPDPVPDVETAWLDNLVIEVIPPCPADCDLDYAHTFFDFLCFQNLFAAGNPRADCDLDGELTVFDFLCFQNYFAQGCE